MVAVVCMEGQQCCCDVRCLSMPSSPRAHTSSLCSSSCHVSVYQQLPCSNICTQSKSFGLLPFLHTPVHAATDGMHALTTVIAPFSQPQRQPLSRVEEPAHHLQRHTSSIVKELSSIARVRSYLFASCTSDPPVRSSSISPTCKNTHTVASATRCVHISSASATKGYHKHIDGKVFTNTRRSAT